MVIYVDTLAKRIFCYCPEDESSESMDFEKAVGFAVPTTETKADSDIFLVVGLEDSIVEVNFSSKTILRVFSRKPPSADMRFVHAKCCADGTLFAGYLSLNWKEGKRGQIFMLNKKLEFEQAISSNHLHRPNGIAWSDTTVYIVDSGAN